MIKNEIRKSPVNAITNFLPTEDVKNSDHFIDCKFCLSMPPGLGFGKQEQPIRNQEPQNFTQK
jgi:hypothetical protein